MVDLWHFTCDHGRAGLGDAGELVPAVKIDPALFVWWPSCYVWLSTLDAPDRAALGLTSAFLACDRSKYRYRVTDSSMCYRWQFARGRHLDNVTALLESDANPALWWVATDPVPVEYAP
jgi:hypothetical protein